MDNKAQTTFEYLLILGAILALVTMVVYVSKRVVPGEEATNVINKTINKTLNLTR